MPWHRPSTAEAATLFLEAKASARPRTIQLTTISGMNTPRDADRAGMKACRDRSTTVTNPAMMVM